MSVGYIFKMAFTLISVEEELFLCISLIKPANKLYIGRGIICFLVSMSYEDSLLFTTLCAWSVYLLFSLCWLF